MSPFRTSIVITLTLSLATALLFPSPWNLVTSLTVIAVFLVVFAFGIAFIRLNFFQPAFCHASTDSSSVALTFDDGPDPDTTDFLLDLLAEHDIKATFFCIGSHAQQYPQILKRMIDEGHAIGNHTMHHRLNTNFLFGDKLQHEIEEAQHAIQDACNVTPQLFRPPMGLMNPHYRNILQKLGLKLIGWNVRSLDLNTDDPNVALRRIETRIRGGSIVLMHDAGQPQEFLNAVLLGVIEIVKNKNLNFVTVDKLQE